jgi:hypothetical protein
MIRQTVVPVPNLGLKFSWVRKKTLLLKCLHMKLEMLTLPYSRTMSYPTMPISTSPDRNLRTTSDARWNQTSTFLSCVTNELKTPCFRTLHSKNKSKRSSVVTTTLSVSHKVPPDHHHLHWEEPQAWMRRNTWTKAKRITTGFLVWIQWAAWMDSLPRYQQCTGGGWAYELKVGSPVKSHRKKTNSFCTIFQSNKLFRRTWFTSLLGKKK